jgi:hypothetical protein
VTRLELPDDAWAVLAPPKKVQERKRRRYLAAMAELAAATTSMPQVANPRYGQPGEPPVIPDPSVPPTSEMLELGDRVGDMLILCLVREWSFGDVTEEVLAELEADKFDPLFRACRELAGDLVPDFSPDVDPKVRMSGSQSSPPGSSTVLSISETPSYAATS